MLLEYEQVQLTTKVTELQKLNSQLEQRLQLKNYSHQNNKCQDNVTSNKEFETHQKKVNTDFSKNNLPTTLANDSARLLSGNLPKSLSNDDGIEKYAKSSYNTKKMCTQRQMQTCKFDRRHKQNDNRIQNSNRYENIKDKRRSKPGRLSTSPMTSDTYAVMVKAVEAKLCALKQRNDDVSRNANCAKKIKLLEKLHSEVVYYWFNLLYCCNRSYCWSWHYYEQLLRLYRCLSVQFSKSISVEMIKCGCLK